MAKIVETPLMKQYIEMKKKHPDAILLFRVGDFYETFSDDAIAASEILGITLTRRANGKAASVELAGFPHHALDSYLPKLVRAGRRVAICEQLEDPKLTKKLVKRGITELITPGINTNDNTISPRRNNFLGAVHIRRPRKNSEPIMGAAFLDITTGEFLCTQGSPESIDKIIGSIAPAEIIRMRGTRQLYETLVTHRCAVNELEDWVYTEEAARDRLLTHFQTSSLKGFGIEDLPAAIIAAGSILHYLDYTKHNHLGHISSLNRIDDSKYVRLDRFTLRNLEIINAATPEGKSLIDIIDKTATPMGSRMLVRWLQFPLLDIDRIRARHDAVDYFFRDAGTREDSRSTLQSMGDLERLVARMSTRRASGRDLLSLRDSLKNGAYLKRILGNADCEPLRNLALVMPDCSGAVADITLTIHPEAPGATGKGQLIANGVDPDLDHLRHIAHGGKDALAEITRREIEATGISSLKIAFNNVFGYYIEVRNTHRDKVPNTWIRKQTLVNAERYITPELKEYEQQILGAEEKIASMESRIFNELLDRLSLMAPDMIRCAQGAARADCLLSFAEAAEEYKYVRPIIDDSFSLEISDGRHPVIERCLPPGESYIPNSVSLDCDSRQIIMITGPNMSGKSALLRQTALIVLLAQTGSFVPAVSARIGIVDKIFTRVGASDNISAGESTFMNEMNEAAAILNNMSPRSLILFDELGRGTSTYDGISIAWAIVEHIHENGYSRPKTLFATHYHELNEMEKSFPRIANFNVSVKEIDGKVVFLRRLERGGSAHSFGIHVAKLAGMPPSIVKRADQVLETLEKDASNPADKKSGAPSVSKADVGDLGKNRDGYQLSFFQLDDPLLSQIRDRLIGIDVNNLTPLQALATLNDLQSLLTGK
ncbi:MAG: DNA mismatch repair protein MutS [Muribaculaceae bacterium]|nr:DNA mismatch repair protein MutS [Muribaculaceae bacterium]